MIFLLNNERVLSEVLELARLKISGILSVRPDEVLAELEVADGKLRPKFQLKLDNPGALEKEYIQKCMADVWLNLVKPELASRLMGLSEVRYGFQKKAAAEEQEEAPGESTAPEGEVKVESGREGPGRTSG